MEISHDKDGTPPRQTRGFLDFGLHNGHPQSKGTVAITERVTRRLVLGPGAPRGNSKDTVRISKRNSRHGVREGPQRLLETPEDGGGEQRGCEIGMSWAGTGMTEAWLEGEVVY